MFSKTLLKTKSRSRNVHSFTHLLYRFVNLCWYDAIRIAAALRSSSAISRTLVTASVTPPTRHLVSGEGITFFFFYVYHKLINFKFVHSYNIKHLTCTILCSSGLQNIYKLHTWKCLTFTILIGRPLIRIISL